MIDDGDVMFEVLRHHVIDGRRCEVKKALTKSEMQSLKSSSGGVPTDAAAAVNNQMATQNYGVGGNMPYGMPPGNMGYQQGSMGSWPQGTYNMDENAAAGNYGYAGAPCNSMNVPFGAGNFAGMNFGHMAGMLGSMLASLGAQGGNIPGAVPGPGMPGAGGNQGQNAAGQNCFIIIYFISIVSVLQSPCTICLNSYAYGRSRNSTSSQIVFLGIVGMHAFRIISWTGGLVVHCCVICDVGGITQCHHAWTCVKMKDHIVKVSQ